MSITLALTWQPRGETLRFRRLYPLLSEIYDSIQVVMPPSTHAGMVLSFRVYKKLVIHVADDWAAGRYLALKHAVDTNTDYIHYADLDRLVRWGETEPHELRYVADLIREKGCLVIGRDKYAMETHPQAIIQTEAASNRFFSHILGMSLDLSAGSKGFSRETAQFILNNSTPGNALGTDSEWVVLARRGGYALETFAATGLAWESADRYANNAVDVDMQLEAAAKYDSDPKNWKHRVRVANEIINSGIDALTRPLVNAISDEKA